MTMTSDDYSPLRDHRRFQVASIPLENTMQPAHFLRIGPETFPKATTKHCKSEKCLEWRSGKVNFNAYPTRDFESNAGGGGDVLSGCVSGWMDGMSHHRRTSKRMLL